MRFHIEQRFDVGLGRLEDILCDPRFVERLGDLPKLGRPELLVHEVDGDEVHQRVRYTFTGDLSSAVRRVVDPAKLTWVEESTLDRGHHTGAFTILPDHYGGLLRCQGTSTLTPEGDGSLRVTEGDIHVSVPLAGAKVERAIVSGLEDHARSEVDLVRQWAPGPDPH